MHSSFILCIDFWSAIIVDIDNINTYSIESEN